MDSARNPQQFIELAAESINRTRRMALVDGIPRRRAGPTGTKA
jgi:type III restriction enzyme